MNDYELIDSGNGRKLERFGETLLARPAAQALWHPELGDKEWQRADAELTREEETEWQAKKTIKELWTIAIDGIRFQLKLTDFGHVGIFPEQRPQWRWIRELVSRRKNPQVLNLFAYSGGSTLAAALGGAEVCHLDASKGMVQWARENALLNGLEEAPIRWIIDDVSKFLAREIRRGRRYDAIILDPPTFGRGPKGELFKIEERLLPLLSQCKELLSDDPLFLLLSCHTPGHTPLVLQQILSQYMEGGIIEGGEMALTGKRKGMFVLPSGAFARWSHG